MNQREKQIKKIFARQFSNNPNCNQKTWTTNSPKQSFEKEYIRMYNKCNRILDTCDIFVILYQFKLK